MSRASIVAIAALTFLAAPAFAQHRGGSSQSSGRAASGHAVAAAPPVVGSAAPTGGGYVRVAPRVIGSAVAVGPGFYSPYYMFRPRLNLGLGFWVGYPVAYPYYAAYPYAYDPYYNPYAYAAPYPGYGYAYPGYAAPTPYSVPYSGESGAAAPGSVAVQPGPATGGLSFEISPASAEVFVDGNDMGVASTFSPTSEPLTLAPGRHHVELHANLYQAIIFDVDVVAGQVIPYQGTMQALRP
jgi:hypothetical protein